MADDLIFYDAVDFDDYGYNYEDYEYAASVGPDLNDPYEYLDYTIDEGQNTLQNYDESDDYDYRNEDDEDDSNILPEIYQEEAADAGDRYTFQDLERVGFGVVGLGNTPRDNFIKRIYSVLNTNDYKNFDEGQKTTALEFFKSLPDDLVVTYNSSAAAGAIMYKISREKDLVKFLALVNNLPSVNKLDLVRYVRRFQS